jgi:hypothetical protein
LLSGFTPAGGRGGAKSVNIMGLGMHGAYKRHAIQLAAQLPEKQEDALLVIQYLRELVEGFLAPTQPQRPVLVVFEGGSAAPGASPSDFCREGDSKSALPK